MRAVIVSVLYQNTVFQIQFLTIYMYFSPSPPRVNIAIPAKS